MLTLLHLVTIILVALAAALSVAHALEYPGKMKLDKETYYAVQTIYYPGFTIGGGVGEGGGMLATLLLAYVTPNGTLAFWFVSTALVGMGAMQGVFWLVTQPINKYWVEGRSMGRLGAAFFGKTAREKDHPEWTKLRDRWEYSHIARAALSSLSLMALLAALVVRV